MISLVDGDLIAYRCSASANDEPLEVAILRCDNLMRQLIDETNADEYMCFLSGPTNFRKEVNPEYKANRKDQEPPKWLQECKEFLITEWKAKMVEYLEADDLLGIEQCKIHTYTKLLDPPIHYQKWDDILPKYDSTIVSLDKDLRMIPGRHYSWEISTAKWVKPAEFKTITKMEGLQNFYLQILTGDTTDNVIGMAGIGPVKARRILEGCETEQEMFDAVYNKYNDPDRFLMNGICLWIMQKEGTSWAQHLLQSDLTIPEELKPKVEALSESMKYFTTIT